MSQVKTKIGEMIEQLQTGQIAPGSKEGIEAIRQIASANPSLVATKLYHLPNGNLEQGMRMAGLPEDDIEELLRLKTDSETPKDPFAEATELKPTAEFEDKMSESPLEYDPAEDMRRGPRRA